MVLVHIPGPSSLPSGAKDYSHAYYHILKSARRHSAIGSSAAAGAVLILVATDTDALCAARAFARLLTEDEIMYRIAPVDGYGTLHRVLEEDVAGNEDLHTLVMLNLGSLLSLPSYFSADALDLPLATHVHLIDSHRPWNLDNLFATNVLMDRIWVWDDGDIVTKMSREREAYEALEFEVDSDEEDDEEESGSEDESESDSEVGDQDEEDRSSTSSGSRKRKRLTSIDSAAEDEDDEQQQQQQRHPPSPRKQKERRRRKRVSRSPKRISSDQRNIYRAILTRYYNRGTCVGMSVAGMIFVLAESLGRAENEGLWLAILGLSHQYLTNTVAYDLYEEHATSLASDVIALNPPTLAANGQYVTNQSSTYLAKPTSADDGRIRVVNDELRFTLYRHWSLENSMYHTAYVAGKLGIWREKGLTKIRGLLAKMGFSLIHSRQHYSHMPLDLRNALITKLEAIAPEYGLTELVFRSFIRSFGYRSNPLSAMDTVEGLNSLLVAATGVKIEVQDEALTFSGATPGDGGRGGYGGQGTPISSELFGAKRTWNLGGSTSSASSRKSSNAEGKENRAPDGQRGDQDEADEVAAKEATASSLSNSNEAWIRNFFIAYEALDFRKSSSLTLLNSSLSLARALHSAVLTVGTSLIDKQSIRTLKSFRLAVLKDGPFLDLFSTQPAMLTRLGLWLTDALRDIVNEQDRKKHQAAQQKKRERRQRKGTEEEDEDLDESKALKSLPFLLCALHQPSSTYLVVGLIGAPDFGDTQRNRFGLAFQDAIRKSGARTRNEGTFEAGVVEIRKEDLGGFVERLSLKS